MDNLISIYLLATCILIFISYKVGQLSGWIQGANHSRRSYKKLIDIQSNNLEGYSALLTVWKNMYLELYAKTIRKQ